MANTDGEKTVKAPPASPVRHPWCLRLAIALILLGAISNTVYLWHRCPLGLSEDESHYWEWSRHLDYGYYSKPPGIAWVIWLAVRAGAMLGINGDGSGTALMPVVRMPAVLFGVLSGFLSLLLARRVFRDDRAALAVTLLSAAVPMFAVGSLLITIDSPMYLCWAASVYCLWRAVEAHSLTSKNRHGWLYAAGFACAAGMMFKPVLIALPACALVAALADIGVRRALKTWHSLGAFALVVLSLVPTAIWNSQHDWVTFKHIATQGGFVGTGGTNKSWMLATLERFGQYIGGQAAGMGGLMFVFVVIAVWTAWKSVSRHRQTLPPDSPELLPFDRTATVFLLSFTLPLWGFYLVMNFWKGTEVNWPAASYFTGMILVAGLFLRKCNSTVPKQRQAWRRWRIITVVWGIALTALAMNTHRLYPLIGNKIPPARWDIPMVRLRAMQDRAAIVDQIRDQLRVQTGQEPLVITGRYDTSSSLAFYLSGHPFVFCIGANLGERQSQYDLWLGINEKNAAGHLVNEGRPAVFVGGINPHQFTDVLQPAFDRVDSPQSFPMTFSGVKLKDVNIYRCYGFKGFPETHSGKY